MILSNTFLIQRNSIFVACVTRRFFEKLEKSLYCYNQEVDDLLQNAISFMLHTAIIMYMVVYIRCDLVASRYI